MEASHLLSPDCPVCSATGTDDAEVWERIARALTLHRRSLREAPS